MITYSQWVIVNKLLSYEVTDDGWRKVLLQPVSNFGAHCPN